MPNDQPLPPVPDLIVAGDHVLTMDAARTVLVDAAVLVADRTIVGVVDRVEAARRHPGVRTLGGPGRSRDAWLRQRPPAPDRRPPDPLVDPRRPARRRGDLLLGRARARRDTAADDELSATLACVEAVTHGVTTTIEAGTVAHPARVAAGMAAVGMRGTIGTWGWDVEDGPFAAPAPEVLERQAAVLDAFPSGGLVTGWVTLVGHDLMSDELVSGASALARSRGCGLTFHLSPSVSDVTAYLARTGRRPLVHLDGLGVLGAHVLVAHAVHLDDAEIDALLRSGAAVAACPWAYLRLGQGVTGAGATPSWCAGAAGWRWVATARTPATWSTPCGRPAVRRTGQGHPCRSDLVRRPRRNRAADGPWRRGGGPGRTRRHHRARAPGRPRRPWSWPGLDPARPRPRAAAGVGQRRPGRAGCGDRRPGRRAGRSLHHRRRRRPARRGRGRGAAPARSGRDRRPTPVAFGQTIRPLLVSRSHREMAASAEGARCRTPTP